MSQEIMQVRGVCVRVGMRGTEVARESGSDN